MFDMFVLRASYHLTPREEETKPFNIIKLAKKLEAFVDAHLNSKCRRVLKCFQAFRTQIECRQASAVEMSRESHDQVA